MSRLTASSTAHSAARIAALEPSMPTTIDWGVPDSCIGAPGVRVGAVAARRGVTLVIQRRGGEGHLSLAWSPLVPREVPYGRAVWTIHGKRAAAAGRETRWHN